MKVGDKIKVQAYKHNGNLHLVSEDTYVLEINEDFIVCANCKAKITEPNGKKYVTKETAILFFYKKHWFNIICQLKKYGIFYYCNIATPYIINNKTLKYIDYDLDLRVFPDGSFKILDKNEYIYHKKKYNYSENLDKILKEELNKLIKIKKKNEFPFKKENINTYIDKFNNIRKDGILTENRHKIE